MVGGGKYPDAATTYIDPLDATIHLIEVVADIIWNTEKAAAIYELELELKVSSFSSRLDDTL